MKRGGIGREREREGGEGREVEGGREGEGGEKESARACQRPTHVFPFQESRIGKPVSVSLSLLHLSPRLPRAHTHTHLDSRSRTLLTVLPNVRDFI